jgi:hypothetical protein
VDVTAVRVQRRAIADAVSTIGGNRIPDRDDSLTDQDVVTIAEFPVNTPFGVNASTPLATASCEGSATASYEQGPDGSIVFRVHASATATASANVVNPSDSATASAGCNFHVQDLELDVVSGHFRWDFAALGSADPAQVYGAALDELACLHRTIHVDGRWVHCVDHQVVPSDGPPEVVTGYLRPGDRPTVRVNWAVTSGVARENETLERSNTLDFTLTLTPVLESEVPTEPDPPGPPG